MTEGCNDKIILCHSAVGNAFDLINFYFILFGKLYCFSVLFCYTESEVRDYVYSETYQLLSGYSHVLGL